MRHTAMIVGLAIAIAAPAVIALTPDERCESAKLTGAGKYGDCRLKAEAKGVRSSASPDYAKCDDKFLAKWSAIESSYGGACPSIGDEAVIEALVTQQTYELAIALAGGPLPACSGNLATCTSNLSTCDANLMSCSSDLDACTDDLASTSTSLDGCVDDLAVSSASLASCNDDLATCTATLGTCPADLANCLASMTQGRRTKTGQTICYNDVGAVIGCSGTGQDGETQSGLPVTYVDHGDGTITDTSTGLTWEKLSDDGSIHDWDTLYTWSAAFTKVANLNTAAFAGHTDWRLPNIFELDSLRNLGTYGPAVYLPFDLCPVGCSVLTGSCTRSGDFWSSTTHADVTGQAWSVNFHSGFELSRSKTLTAFARAVRGGS